MHSSNIDSIVQEFVDQEGWDDNTVLGLALQYIENQQSADAFRDFLAENADEEDEEDEEPAQSPTCSQCHEKIEDTDERAGYGMCGSCLHDALRSGWTPGEED